MGKGEKVLALTDLFFKQTGDTRLQFIRYIGVGGFAAIVNIGGLVLCKEILNIHYLIANVIGFLLGLITNFFLSKKYIFTINSNMNRVFEFGIHGVISIAGLILDTLFIWVFTHFLELFYLLSKVLSTAIVFVWNFVARKVFYYLNCATKITNQEEL